jgi:cyclophilin family peptidyl-prolyl cis-trans isomerase
LKEKKTMPISRLLIVAALCLFFWPAADALADAASDRAEYEQTFAQFRELLRQSQEVQNRFAAAPPDQRAALEEKHSALVREGTDMLPKLKVQAEKVYLANPKDQKVADLMFAMVITAMRADEYDEVLRICHLLIDHNYARDELYNLAGIAAFSLSDFDDAEKYLNTAVANKSIDPRGQELLNELPDYRQKWARELKFQAADAKAGNLPRVKLTVADHANKIKGEIVVELFEDEAPNTVANFVSLVGKHFYDGLKFHRVLPGFMAQGGDPKGDGTGGPGYRIPDEFALPNHRDHFRGSLSMAHAADKDTAGSQFFICFAPAKQLDDHFTVFGRVVEGLDVLAKIRRIDPDHPSPTIQADKILKAELIRKRQHDYSPKTLQ